MDLLGDLGTADQLTSTRAENKVLAEKVKELSERVKVLTLENQQLLAEVEIYRKEAAMPKNSNNMALGKSVSAEEIDVFNEHGDEFVKSGDGVYPSDAAVTLSNLHSSSNPLCCALDSSDTVLATGGADACVTLSTWGGGLAPHDDASEKVVENAARIRCDAPVICLGFCYQETICAAGCMDGSVRLVQYTNPPGGSIEAKLLSPEKQIKHLKYVKSCAWCPTEPILATASAAGNVILSKVIVGEAGVEVETMQTLHLSGAVEAMCFSDNGRILYCYARGTPYLSCFDLQDDCQQTKINLNCSGVNGGFEDHVSFAVMDMATSPNNGGKYLALATDSSRNIIIDAKTGKQIRNLYGHTNDGFSQPKIAWSHNGQYLFGNTQTDNSICVWDIASSSIIKSLDDKTSGGHKGQVRGIFSSRNSDTVVTTSFDKDTKIWLTPM